jgi:hypothetical protein
VLEKALRGNNLPRRAFPFKQMLSHAGQRYQAEIALQQKYNQQEQARVDTRLKQATTFW